jgi:hypothetical protein
VLSIPEVAPKHLANEYKSKRLEEKSREQDQEHKETLPSQLLSFVDYLELQRSELNCNLSSQVSVGTYHFQSAANASREVDVSPPSVSQDDFHLWAETGMLLASSTATSNQSEGGDGD